MFNPNSSIIQISTNHGPKDYLPVAARLQWFREQCPDGVIETEMLLLDLDREVEATISVWNAEKRRSEKVVKRAKGICIFKATVWTKCGCATGTKQENAASFDDFIEKSETGAIGRALAGLGFGTVNCGDELDEQERVVDSPVVRPQVAEDKVLFASSTNKMDVLRWI